MIEQYAVWRAFAIMGATVVASWGVAGTASAAAVYDSPFEDCVLELSVLDGHTALHDHDHVLDIRALCDSIDLEELV